MVQNPITAEEESMVDSNTIGPTTRGGIARYEYNFNRDGGAVGAIELRGPILPIGAVIAQAYIDIVTVPVGSGASIALSMIDGTINDADGIGGAPWNAVGTADADAPEIGSEENYFKLTSPRGMRMTIGSAVLTAGRFFVIVRYDFTGN